MAAVSQYLANKLIDHMRGVGTAYALPTVYMALCTTATTPTAQGTEGVVYTNYARQPLAGLLAAATAQSGNNSSIISFPQCGATGATIVGFFTADSLAANSGNVLEYGTCGLNVSSGITPSFAVGAFITSMT